jgi:hypothetical protein
MRSSRSSKSRFFYETPCWLARALESMSAGARIRVAGLPGAWAAWYGPLDRDLEVRRRALEGGDDWTFARSAAGVEGG